jgi:tetratricopeptide (TPR) repeat protein
MDKSGRFQEAMVLYEQALRENPENVDALNNMGVLYMRDRDYPAAREAFSEAVRVRPNYVDAYYNLACVYALEERLIESLVHLEKAVSLDESVKAWARNDTDLANIREMPDFEEIMGAAKP